MVIQWNRIALAAIQNANGATPPGLNQPPPLAPIHLAMVHTAIYDAVNAIDPTHEPYLDGLSAPATASKAAAIATAAHHVLVGLVPVSLPLVKEDLDTQVRRIRSSRFRTALRKLTESPWVRPLQKRSSTTVPEMAGSGRARS